MSAIICDAIVSHAGAHTDIAQDRINGGKSAYITVNFSYSGYTYQIETTLIARVFATGQTHGNKLTGRYE